jgi:hypothetical protein
MTTADIDELLVAFAVHSVERIQAASFTAESPWVPDPWRTANRPVCNE